MATLFGRLERVPIFLVPTKTPLLLTSAGIYLYPRLINRELFRILYEI